jgi:hypothetical protein
MTHCIVILSGVSNSRSELLAESKDPTYFIVANDLSGNSHGTDIHAHSAQRECLSTISKLRSSKGSFDYVSPALRYGTYSAQDDTVNGL